MITKAYYDSDGKFVRATVESKDVLFRAQSGGLFFICVGAFLLLGLLRLGRDPHCADYAIGSCFGWTSVVFIALGILIHLRTPCKGVHLTSDGFNTVGGHRLTPWANVARFIEGAMFHHQFLRYGPWGGAMKPSLGVEFSDGCSHMLLDLSAYTPAERAAWIDLLNRFRTADAAGRADLVRPFTPITLKPGK